MVYTPHIPLSQRKTLCGRLIYFDTAPPHENDFIAEGAADTFALFRDELFQSLAKEVKADKTNAGRQKKPLDQALKDAFKRFKNTVSAQELLEEKPQLTGPLLASIEKKVSGVSCAGCSPGKICDGADIGHDSGIVAAAGRCIEPLKQMFDVASEAAYIYYSTLSTVFPGVRPDIVFSTRLLGGPGGGLPAQWVVDGVTTFHDERARAVALAQLKLHPPQFDLDNYKAVLYVLFHECIAHCYHAIAPGHAGRKTTRRYEHFAEGWMDWVSLKVLEQVLSGTGPARALRSKIKPTNVYAVASTFHEDRLKFEPEDYDGTEGEPGHLKYGASVAQAVYNFIQEQYNRGIFKPRKAFANAFFSLSFDLNMSNGFTDSLRDKFIPFMNKLVYPREYYENVPGLYRKRVAAEELIKDYLRTRDTDLLLQNLSQQ